MLRGKFQKASNLIHLYDPRRAPYPTKVWNHSTTSSQIHPPSTGYIRGTIHYQSYRILKENQVNKAGVISFEWSFHCIHMNGITRKTSYTKVVNKTAKFEYESGRVWLNWEYSSEGAVDVLKDLYPMSRITCANSAKHFGGGGSRQRSRKSRFPRTRTNEPTRKLKIYRYISVYFYLDRFHCLFLHYRSRYRP